MLPTTNDTENGWWKLPILAAEELAKKMLQVLSAIGK